MAKAKTTAELTKAHTDMTAEMVGQDIKIANLDVQIEVIWGLLFERMDGDGRVTKAKKAATEKLVAFVENYEG